MRTPHLAHTGRVLLIGIGLSLFAGCYATSGSDQMTKEQRLGYYLENSLRYYDLRDLPRAIDQATRGLELEPRNERLLLIKARCHLQLDTRDDILTAVSILKKHPNQKDYRVRMTLAEGLERKGLLYDLAADEIASGERYTDEADPLVAAEAMRVTARKNWTEAIGHYRASTQLFTGGIESLNGLMRVQTFLGQDADALETAKKLVVAIDESSQVLRVRLRELESSENDSWPIQRQIYGNDKLLASVHLHMSELYHAKGEHLEALGELDEVLRLDPDWPAIYSRRGALFLALGDPARARDAIVHFMAQSELPYEHPDIQRAQTLLSECDSQLEAVDRANQIGDGSQGG